MTLSSFQTESVHIIMEENRKLRVAFILSRDIPWNAQDTC